MKKTKNSAIYIYFVLYIVVIAELMIVINERDVLLDELKGKLTKLEVGKYINKIILGVSEEKENVFTLQYSGEGSYTVSCFSRNTISDEEKNSGYFEAKLAPGSVAFFPANLSTKDPDNLQRGSLIRKENNCALTLRANQKDFLNSNLAWALKDKQQVPVTYHVVLKTPRKMPAEYSFGTIDSILNKVLDGSADKLIDSAYGEKKGKKEKELVKNQLVLRYLLGLEPKQLFDLLRNTGNRYYFNYPEIGNEVKKASNKIESLQNEDEKEPYYKNLMDIYQSKFKGNKKYGFDNSEDFYYFVTDKIPLTVNLSFY